MSGTDTTPTGLTLGIDVAPVITAGLNAAGAVIKLTTAELAYLNSPQAIAARQAQAEQKQRGEDAEAVTEALKGDGTKLQERSS